MGIWTAGHLKWRALICEPNPTQKRRSVLILTRAGHKRRGKKQLLFWQTFSCQACKCDQRQGWVPLKEMEAEQVKCNLLLCLLMPQLLTSKMEVRWSLKTDLQTWKTQTQDFSVCAIDILGDTRHGRHNNPRSHMMLKSSRSPFRQQHWWKYATCSFLLCHCVSYWCPSGIKCF